MEKNTLSKTLTTKDTLALAFGCMIGWGWVVLAGNWIEKGGTLGAVGGFIAAGIILCAVALLYAELASAMPKAGGAQNYAMRAFGKPLAFICSWSLIFGYLSITTFEAVALPQVIETVFGELNHVLLWQVAGFDVYLSFALVGAFGSLIMSLINIVGIKTSAVFQTSVTFIILIAGIALASGGFYKGTLNNLQPFYTGGIAASVIAVMVMAPFMMGGFDVIPQAAEEINLPPKKIGNLIVQALIMGTVWYCMIILSVAAILGSQGVFDATLPAIAAARQAWGGWGGQLLIIGGLAGIVTSWNGFFIGGSRAIYALAKAGMLPGMLAKLHPAYKTPYNAILLIGLLGCIAPFFGRQLLVWIANAGSFGLMIAYGSVSLSFIKLRAAEPEMSRPFRVPAGMLIGWIGLIGSIGLCLLYLPWSSGALVWPYEWIILIAWYAFGLVCLSIAIKGQREKESGDYLHAPSE